MVHVAFDDGKERWSLSLSQHKFCPPINMIATFPVLLNSQAKHSIQPHGFVCNSENENWIWWDGEKSKTLILDSSLVKGYCWNLNFGVKKTPTNSKMKWKEQINRNKLLFSFYCVGMDNKKQIHFLWYFRNCSRLDFYK